MKKTNTPTIAKKLRRYLIFFAVSILGSLWLFQGFFLDRFYSLVKTREIVQLSHRIENSYLNGSLNDFAKTALETSSQVQIVNARGQVVLDSGWQPNPYIQQMSSRIYQYIFNSLSVGKGRVIDIKQFDATSNLPKTTLSYALKLDNNALLFIQTELVPVGATVAMIRIQLILISIIIISLALFIANRFSSQISKPMVAITEDAGVLTTGDYNHEIKVHGYQEIEVLSDTLNQLRVDLKRVESMRNELLSNVSHDLRTPLTMITGYIELMKDFPQERTVDNFDLIANEALRLKEMVQTLLDLSRIQQGIESIQMKPVDSKAWLESTGLRYQKLAIQRQIVVKADDAVVEGDPTLLNQALENLINNALAHTEGSILIQGTNTDNGYVVEVIDEGPGIPSDDIQRIWDRYYTTNLDHARDQKGFGLGLSIVKGIFDSHKIHYSAKNNPDKGATFTFTLKYH